MVCLQLRTNQHAYAIAYTQVSKLDEYDVKIYEACDYYHQHIRIKHHDMSLAFAQLRDMGHVVFPKHSPASHLDLGHDVLHGWPNLPRNASRAMTSATVEVVFDGWCIDCS